MNFPHLPKVYIPMIFFTETAKISEKVFFLMNIFMTTQKVMFMTHIKSEYDHNSKFSCHMFGGGGE